MLCKAERLTKTKSKLEQKVKSGITAEIAIMNATQIGVREADRRSMNEQRKAPNF